MLSVDGLKEDHIDLAAMITNRSCKLRVVYANGKQPILYKANLNLLKFLHMTKERGGLKGENQG